MEGDLMPIFEGNTALRFKENYTQNATKIIRICLSYDF